MSEILRRAVFRPNDGGKDFAVYFDGEQIDEKIAEAAASLKAVVLFSEPSTKFIMLCEQIERLSEAKSEAK